MGNATYTTDLTTWDSLDAAATNSEFTGWTATNKPVSPDTDNPIQGTGMVSSEQRTTGTGSIAIQGTDPAGFTESTGGVTGDCWFLWGVFLQGGAIDVDKYGGTVATAGYVMMVGSGTGAFDAYPVGGSDFGRNPYGGWQNWVIDPSDPQTSAATTGSPTAGTYTQVGFGCNVLSAISKGSPYNCDVIRWGRGEIICIDGLSGGTAGTFVDMAQENDYNDAVNGYNVWGLFQDAGGSYLWKGLMTLGNATACVFDDSNQNIIIDNTRNVLADFNRIEINNASSDITWTSINFTALGTIAAGEFEVVDAATLAFTTCVFTDMSTFIFNGSNNALVDCTFRRCDTVTSAGATLIGSNIVESTVAADAGALVYNTATDTDGVLDGMTFSQGTNAHHAIDFGTSVTGDITLRDCEFTGFDGTENVNGSTFRFLATSGSLNLNLIGCTVGGASASQANIGVDDAAGISVTVVISPVSETVNVKGAGNNLENARVLVETAATIASGEMFEAATTSLTSLTGTATCTTTAAHGLVTGDYVVIRGAQPDEYNRVAIVTVSSTTVFTYPVTTGIATTATGTPVVSFAALSGLTDASGNITATRTWNAAQEMKGWARKINASSPFWKQGEISYTIDNTNGNTVNVALQPDE